MATNFSFNRENLLQTNQFAGRRWNLRSRQTFGNCKAYDFLVSYGERAPEHPKTEIVSYRQASPRTRTKTRASTPSGGRATKAPQRCWEMYKECCITGTGQLLECDTLKPPDIIACHIFPYAYRDQWVSKKWSTACTDCGPDGKCSHEYTDFHQICCLNNMIPLRADIQKLWDANEIGVDIWDDNRVISFSMGRGDLTEYHLQVDIVDELYRPYPPLLTDHLAQGVRQCCLYPGWKPDDEPPSTGLDPLVDEVTRASTQINQFSMKETEHGEGKVAFEDSLHAALSIRNDTVPML